MQEPTRLNFGEGRCRWSSMSESGSIGPAGVMATACRHRRPNATREAPAVIADRVRFITNLSVFDSNKRSEVADGATRKSEGIAGFRFYALYDKVYREDV